MCLLHGFLLLLSHKMIPSFLKVFYLINVHYFTIYEFLKIDKFQLTYTYNFRKMRAKNNVTTKFREYVKGLHHTLHFKQLKISVYRSKSNQNRKNLEKIIFN